MCSGKIVSLSAAFSQIDIATMALEKAMGALSKSEARELPTHALREDSETVDALARKVLELVKEERESRESSVPADSEHCDHPEQVVRGLQLLYITTDVAAEEQAEQEAQIRQYMSR